MPLPTSPGHAVPLFRLLLGIADAVALPVYGLALDSRRVQPGDLFLALKGEQHDGRDYLAAVAQAGACAAVVEAGLSAAQRSAAGQMPIVEVPALDMQTGRIAARFYGHPSERLATVGITGTNGKTTTSRVLAQLLRAGFGSCGVIGTLGATLGDDTVEAANTTPDAVSLHSQLADWVADDVAAAVLEVSSHSLVQGRVGGITFDTAVFTNLTHDHLDYHGDMDSYAAAKARLFAVEGLKHAVINGDDDYAAVMRAAVAPGVEVIEYGIESSSAAVRASDISYHHGGLEAQLHTPWGDGLVHSPMAGDFNLANLLAAISAACLNGMGLELALEAIPELKGVEGRMQYVANERDLQLVVDYAHTPDALAQALRALRAHTEGQLHCVFGCGGDRDRDKRPVMGRAADELADRVIVTSDNPRHEPPMAIIDEILTGISGAHEVEPDRARAIALAVATAAPGDCILVAGKGHETYQQVGAERLDFSDVVELRRALTGDGGAR
jgi:UDP-N-acetylmuramoyl-L-alanyl-D-glutamate--2,6-diaminopimelate ligase